MTTVLAIIVDPDQTALEQCDLGLQCLQASPKLRVIIINKCCIILVIVNYVC